MRVSRCPITTLRETPADAEVVSHQLMLRAGMIRRLASGLYTWMPYGLRVLRKVEAIVREEMNNAGAIEVLMPSVQPAELWQESGRWEKYGAELLRIRDRHQRDFCYGPTHEEIITDYARKELSSYKQLPINFYQIQTKFRDEVRPRFGVMRAREFLMKDAYSFHLDKSSLEETYNIMFNAYQNIFKRLGLDFRAVKADTGNIGGSTSHEFQVIAQSGEDILAFSDESDFAINIELNHDLKDGDPSPDGKGKLKLARGIEVGHIFQLGDLYSQALKAEITDETGKKVPMQMGCYGIGVSRIVAAAIEQCNDEKGIIWPKAMAPFDVVIIPVNDAVKDTCEKIYHELRKHHVDVLWDDRDARLGAKLADCELMGIPKRIVVGDRNLKNNQVEFQLRTDKEAKLVSLDEIIGAL